MDRREITFSQAEGVEELPSPLRTGELSDELRAHLWRILYVELEESRRSIDYYGYVVGDPWLDILRSWHVDHEYKLYDEFKDKFDDNVSRMKNIVYYGNYVQVFELIQFIIRKRDCPPDFHRLIDKALGHCRAAYRVIEKTIMPVSEAEEVEAIRHDLTSIRSSPFVGAYRHLESAMSLISSGDDAGAVRESIHAVESACKQLEPNAATLGPALKALEASGAIHGGLKEAFLRLYGYASDEEGVRHALVFKDTAAVDEADGIFMFAACAAFIGYLSRKKLAA